MSSGSSRNRCRYSYKWMTRHGVYGVAIRPNGASSPGQSSLRPRRAENATKWIVDSPLELFKYVAFVSYNRVCPTRGWVVPVVATLGAASCDGRLYRLLATFAGGSWLEVEAIARVR